MTTNLTTALRLGTLLLGLLAFVPRGFAELATPASDKELVQKLDAAMAHFQRTKRESTYWSADENLIAYSVHKVANPRGAILVIPGYGEGYVKYYETIYDFNRAGYNVYLSDLRGFGRSERILANPQKGHVENFEDYAKDVAVFITNIVSKDPSGQFYLYSHSTGGLVAFRVLEQFPTLFNSAAFSSPLTAVNTGKVPKWLANSVTKASDLTYQGDAYVWGKSDRDYRTEKFEDQTATHDRTRYDHYRAYLLKAQDPSLVSSGPTHHWVVQVGKESAHLPTLSTAISTPVLILEAGKDTYVETSRYLSVCGRLASCDIVRFKDAYHELMRETGNIRDSSISETLRHFALYDSSVSPRRVIIEGIDADLYPQLKKLLSAKDIGTGCHLDVQTSGSQLTLALTEKVEPNRVGTSVFDSTVRGIRYNGKLYRNDLRKWTSAAQTIISGTTFQPVTANKWVHLWGSKTKAVGLERTRFWVVLDAQGKVTATSWRLERGDGDLAWGKWNSVSNITCRAPEAPIALDASPDTTAKGGDPKLAIAFQAKGINIGWDLGIVSALSRRLTVPDQAIAYSGNSSGSLPATYFACHGLGKASVERFAKIYANVDRNLVNDSTSIPGKLWGLLWQAKSGYHGAKLEASALHETFDSILSGCKVNQMQPLLITSANREVVYRHWAFGLPRFFLHRHLGIKSGIFHSTLDQKTYDLKKNGKLHKSCTYFVNRPAYDIITRAPRKDLYCDVRLLTSLEDLNFAMQASVAEPTYFKPLNEPNPAAVELAHGGTLTQRNYNGGYGQFSIGREYKRAIPGIRTIGTGRTRFDYPTAMTVYAFYRQDQDEAVQDANWWFDMNVDQSQEQYDTLYAKVDIHSHFKLGCEQMVRCLKRGACSAYYEGMPATTTDIAGRQVRTHQGLGGLVKEAPEQADECKLNL